MDCSDGRPHPAQTVTPEQLQEGICLLVDFPELGTPLFFRTPARVIIAWHPWEVRPALRLAETEAKAGRWIGGWLAYEAAAAFALPVHAPMADLPLAWFAIFDEPPRPALYDDPGPWPRLTVVPEIDYPRFQHDLEQIATWIATGESYQVNYTLSAALQGELNPAALFMHLQTRHRFPRAMWVHNGPAWSMASFSPELFLERQGRHLTTAPIKGTSSRAPEAATDRLQMHTLQQSAKDRAEHVMIVDMARNDLGQICQTGSVTVERLAVCRSFSSVHHLETRVQGVARTGTTLEETLAALFPAASITGAPKKRTMEMIRQLEQRPRGLYTGIMGVLKPGGDGWFNVAIRTVLHTPTTGPIIGLGGGVVADSQPKAEWNEIADKARFLTASPTPLELIETFRIDPEGEIPWLDLHLTRLTRSAATLGIPLEPDRVAHQVRTTVAAWHTAGWTPLTGRLTLTSHGTLTLNHRPTASWPPAPKVRLAAWQPDPHDPLLRHKTNRRLHYDAELAQAYQTGYDEVLFINRAGQVTEGAISSLLVHLDGDWVAPPVTDGLCPSIWQTQEINRLQAKTASLTQNDLKRATEIRLGNAVRGGCSIRRIDDVTGQMFHISDVSFDTICNASQKKS
ncbi:MAG: hypothetical protein G8237_03275 [Magnetococcales bacterium]|nr:hypothetical protein [Magnetococcales bacterium]